MARMAIGKMAKMMINKLDSTIGASIRCEKDRGYTKIFVPEGCVLKKELLLNYKTYGVGIMIKQDKLYMAIKDGIVSPRVLGDQNFRVID